MRCEKRWQCSGHNNNAREVDINGMSGVRVKKERMDESTSGLGGTIDA